MPAWTAFGTKSRISVAWVSRGSAPAASCGRPPLVRRALPLEPHPANPSATRSVTARIATTARERGLVSFIAAHPVNGWRRVPPGILTRPSAMASAPYTSELAESLAPELLERFSRYVRIDTQSARASDSWPSTPGQLDLGRLLVEELKELGLTDAAIDDGGYVMATLPGTNSASNGAAIGLLAHVDTTPDAPGAGVEPLVHQGYDGGVIELPKNGTRLDPEAMPELRAKRGHDIVTGSGDTLLGADDKAGVAEIMTAVSYLTRHPELPRATFRIGFTPDEEIGLGATRFDIERFGARCAYTVDGSELGELQDETFSAAEVTITVRGVDVHPGMGTGKLVNALRLAAKIVAALPADRLAPETTADREGFIHPYRAHRHRRRGHDPLDRPRLRRRPAERPHRAAEANGARDRRSGTARTAGDHGQPSVPEHAPVRRADAGDRRQGSRGDPRRRDRAVAGADPGRHRRIAALRARAADAEHLHRRPRLPLRPRVGVAPGHGGRGRDARPSRRGLDPDRVVRRHKLGSTTDEPQLACLARRRDHARR